MIRKFDGSHATFKKTYPVPKVAELEERIQHGDILAGSKTTKSMFESEAVRFKNDRERSPGPATYDPQTPTYILQGQSEAVF